jgi:hypothetical protein
MRSQDLYKHSQPSEVLSHQTVNMVDKVEIDTEISK